MTFDNAVISVIHMSVFRPPRCSLITSSASITYRETTDRHRTVLHVGRMGIENTFEDDGFTVPF